MTDINHKTFLVTIPLWLIVVSLLVSVPLLFIGGPNYYDNRIIKLLWDLGHIPFMFFTGLLLVSLLSRLAVMPYWAFFGLYACIAVMIAVVTEYLQGKVGRITSLSDVLADLWGALLAWLYIGCYPKGRRFKWKVLFYGLALGLGGGVLTKPAITVYDEVLAKRQFPLIAGFESSSELSRWSARGGFEQSRDRATEGQYSLKVLLLPEGYSGTSVNDFPADWQEYDYFRFDVWSPLSFLPLTVRMHDMQHVEGEQHYNDRFNRRYQLKKGWNRILIDLNDVLHAPKGRLFRLDEVEGVGWFSYNLGTTETIYLDQVMLLRK
ncbi:hypothetical protein [Alkalimarinus sediminis]|uniref:Uncharacterized protein n=1 Tax=Alkalimarinus sediminis TaxID=1632866 RepID=A0A9E8KPU9_9ALTE|nr:hypothetical protein [Alkalimarinus sediminis]UZW74555.1 hypothetical protein NNL22_16250 [Alkalimarinus sediminis]